MRATNTLPATAPTARQSLRAAYTPKAAVPAVLAGLVAPRPVAPPKARPEAAPTARRPKAAAAHHACRCADFGTGCTATTARTFAPGHDAKLGSLLQKAALAGELVHDAASAADLPALQVASWFPFGLKVAARVADAQAKLGAIRDRDAAHRA